MFKWITAVFGIVIVLAVRDLNAQASRPSNFKPIYPSAPAPAPRAQPGQTVQQSPIAASSLPQPDSTAPTPIVAQSMELLDNTRKLGVGDRLSFRVTQDRDQVEPKSIMITDMGEAEFPLIGRVPAAGKTLKQLAYQVKQLLDKDYYYNSTVLIGLDASSRFRGRIYVIGSVGAVGPQDIPSDEVFTVSKAILRAGGFGDFADQRKVKLVRKGAPSQGDLTASDKNGEKKDEVIVDCKAIFKGDPNAVDPVLLPDDMIVVPQRLINF